MNKLIHSLASNPIFQNLVAGLIGSAITFSCLKLFKYTKDYFYAKKFYFGGVWNTIFEDNEGLLRVKRYAPAKIIQRGRNISGYTIFGKGEEARKWNLDGSIIADRFLVGSYSIRSRYGEYSIGSFFLERSTTGQELVGYWCGYDPMIGNVNYGNYVFYRKANTMIQTNIRPTLKVDVEKIKELGNEIFGDGYLDNWNIFKRDQNSLDDHICLVATKDTNVIGMIDVRIIYRNILADFKDKGFDLLELDKIKNDKKDFPDVFLNLIMVNEKYRRRGIGTSLYAKAFQISSEINIGSMYATCWKESPNSGIIPFLEKQGWKSISSKSKYWYEDSIKNNYKCARCGTPCFCTAVLMHLDIQDQIIL